MIQFENTIKRYGEIILNELNENHIKCWVAGGTLRDYFMGVPSKTDIDLFFPDGNEYDKTKEFFKRNNAEIIWESDNGMKLKYKEHIFDLVKYHFLDPQETINNFDFTVSMFAVDNEKVYYGETSFIDLSKRQLMINKISIPPSTLSRAFRYYKKGFSMCHGEMKKLVGSIQEMQKTEERIENLTDDEIQSSGGRFFAGFD